MRGQLDNIYFCFVLLKLLFSFGEVTGFRNKGLRYRAHEVLRSKQADFLKNVSVCRIDESCGKMYSKAKLCSAPILEQTFEN